jgi:maleylpyruvate isomerase
VKLYNYWRSSSSWRVRIALALKSLKYEYVPVHLVRDGGQQHAAAYTAKNPLAQVPTLELADGTLLRQSLAIIEYLDEAHPNPPLLPKDAIARARVREAAEIINSAIQPMQNLGTLQRLKALGADEKAWAKGYIEQGLKALEALASAHGGKYLIGDAVSLADVCLIPQIYGARRFEADLALSPTVAKIADRVAGEKAFAETHPDKQPDANA